MKEENVPDRDMVYRVVTDDRWSTSRVSGRAEAIETRDLFIKRGIPAHIEFAEVEWDKSFAPVATEPERAANGGAGARCRGGSGPLCRYRSRAGRAGRSHRWTGTRERKR